MGTSSNQGVSKGKSYKNPFEAISDLGSSTVKSTVDSFKKMGGNIVNSLIGYQEPDYSSQGTEKNKQISKDKVEKQLKQLKEKQKKGNIFNFTEHRENVLIKRQIKELTEQVRQEIEILKKADKTLLAEVQDVEKLAINDVPEKPGIYHIRFLEIVLSILKAVRAKVSESRTWLQALISKKKKRGSLFAARTKEKGTQYSLSQELSNARSVQ